MFNMFGTLLDTTPLSINMARSRKSYGLDLTKVTDHSINGRRVTVMTHVPKGRRWNGPGITGSVRRRVAKMS